MLYRLSIWEGQYEVITWEKDDIKVFVSFIDEVHANLSLETYCAPPVPVYIYSYPYFYEFRLHGWQCR